MQGYLGEKPAVRLQDADAGKAVIGMASLDSKAADSLAKDAARTLDETSFKAQAAGQGAEVMMLAGLMRQIADQMDKEIIKSTREVVDLCRTMGKHGSETRTPDNGVRQKAKFGEGEDLSKETARDNPLYVDVLKLGLKGNQAHSSDGPKSVRKETSNTSDSAIRDAGPNQFLCAGDVPER